MASPNRSSDCRRTGQRHRRENSAQGSARLTEWLTQLLSVRTPSSAPTSPHLRPPLVPSRACTSFAEDTRYIKSAALRHCVTRSFTGMAISWLSASRSAAGHSTHCSVKPHSPHFIPSQHGAAAVRASVRRSISSSTQAPKNASGPGRSRMLEGVLVGAGLTLALSYYAQQRSIKLDGVSVGHGSDDVHSRPAKTTTHDVLPEPPEVHKYASKEEIQQAIEELRKALPGEGLVLTDPDSLKLYGHSDNSYHPTSPHSVVVCPRSTEDVVHIVNIARKYRVPIVPYSGATSLEGHFSGVRSGLCWSLNKRSEPRLLSVSYRGYLHRHVRNG